MIPLRQPLDLGPKSSKASGFLHLTATRLFIISFIVLIGAGTVGLLVLPGLYAGPRLGLIDALFTATSAICVTGLIVVDTATYFTRAGQIWILLLIQVGGLGILTFTTLFISLLGRRATLRMEEAAGGHAYIIRNLDHVGLVKAVVVSTLILELAGAAVLWLLWSPGMGAGGALWPAAFHAISAFCNAGFSIFSDSLVRFQGSAATLFAVAGIIVAGGLGFIVLADLHMRYIAKRATRLGTHTRLVLMTNASLLGLGAILFYLFEVHGDLRQLDWLDRAANAIFMSVTPRTAGFNAISYDSIANPTLFLTMLFMVIGGSPGSTAGGLKTTTFALLALVFWSRLRGKRHVNVAGRTVPEETVAQAAGLAVGGIIILALAVFLLAIIETPSVEDRTEFLRLVFEAHSAFGTVGLSMGATTSSLSPLGRLIIILLMFVGRVGPLAVVSAMTTAQYKARVRYRHPYENVVIG